MYAFHSVFVLHYQKSFKSNIIKNAQTDSFSLLLFGSWIKSEIMGFFVFSHMHMMARNWSKATVKIQTKMQLRILPLIQLFLCDKQLKITMCTCLLAEVNPQPKLQGPENKRQ